MLIIPCMVFEFNAMRTEWEYFGDITPIFWLAVSGTVAFALSIFLYFTFVFLVFYFLFIFILKSTKMVI